MASLDSLETLLQDEIKDIYDAEKQLTKALPKLVKKASTDELKEAITEHLRVTEGHIERLEQVFEQMEMPVRGKKCTGMQNLIKEGDELISEAEEGAPRDAVMIAAAQKVEHYEIATYGTLRTWANRLGKGDVAALFEETLDEEKEADQKLTTIAENLVNPQAAESGEREEDEQETSTRTKARKGASRTLHSVAADRARRRGKRS
jgi:ferritin-like metal-binding protein YciE